MAMKQEQARKSWFDGEQFVSGWAGGSISVLVAHPVDTIKTRLQSRPGVYKNMRDSFSSIYRIEGFRGFYKGFFAPFCVLPVNNAILFYTEDRFKQMGFDGLQTGAGAGFVQSFFTSPAELVKTQLQVQGMKGKIASGKQYSMHEIFKRIYTNYGVRGIYKGLTVTIVRDMPAFAVYFYVFSYLSEDVFNITNYFTLYGFIAATFSGGIAGCTSFACNYPVDVVKSRVQADKISGHKTKYNGAYDCFKKLYRSKKSLRGKCKVFFSGFNPTMVRGFILNGIMFYSIGCFKQYMQMLQSENEEYTSGNSLIENSSKWNAVAENLTSDMTLRKDL